MENTDIKKFDDVRTGMGDHCNRNGDGRVFKREEIMLMSNDPQWGGTDRGERENGWNWV